MNKRKKICLVSSSGGHFEQLKMLKELENEHEIFFVTEKTKYQEKADYFLIQTGSKDKGFIYKMIKNFAYSLNIWVSEKPDLVITTGTMVAIPLAIYSKVFKKKLIYIETYARVYDGTMAGKFMYKFADLFIIQWESLKEIYPNAVYGGSIY